ncbi:MAG: ZIP family metal transporter [Thermoplasmatota archaeon]
MASGLLVPLAALTFLSTLGGGVLAIRNAASLRYFFAFGAGTVLAISFADLLPEAIDNSEGNPSLRLAVFYTIIGSFVLFHFVERYVLVHPVHEHHEGEALGSAEAHDHAHAAGGLGATGLVVHSLIDGIAIGAAFQASAAIGVVVALAVIAHDFADGVNTVTLTRRISTDRKRAVGFLVADAAAPVVGALATLFFTVPVGVLALVLAFFVGHFLYIGAADLLPEMHRGERSWGVFGVHLAGILAIVVLTRILAF